MTEARSTSRAPLILVVALALCLRFWAIDWGAPYVYHPDEHLVVHPALNIVHTRDLNPHWFQYPSLLIYLQAGVVAALEPFVRVPLISDAEQNRIGPWDVLPAQWPFVLAGRCWVAAFAVVGVVLIYFVGVNLRSSATGFAAAFFLAASPLHNESSHYLTTDVVATTLMTAALLASVRWVHGGKDRQLIVAALFSGLAAATKYTAGIALLVPLALCATSSAATASRWMKI
ncbi:MAG TPA: glycosyltransferase family 39 protein, partial [Candidatus Acidoferrales bacterium]|nr:glycosyltransferase family 39 protein [Candidatus Acidoferrales bacterium]